MILRMDDVNRGDMTRHFHEELVGDDFVALSGPSVDAEESDAALELSDTKLARD